MKRLYKVFILMLALILTAASMSLVSVIHAEEEVDKPDNPDWVRAAGITEAKYDEEKGMTEISNFKTWGHRSYYNYKVKLDGLVITLEATMSKGDCVGFLFASSTDAYLGDSTSNLAFTLWKGIYSNGAQSRFHIGTNHNYNSTSLVYVSPDLSSNKGFNAANSMVITDAPTMGLRIAFDKYDDDWYKITISMTAASMWTSNANYNATGGPNDEPSCHVFLHVDALTSAVDQNGETYVIGCGFPSDNNPYVTGYYKIEDANLRTYQQTTLQSALDAIEEYETAIGNITDEGTFDLAMEKRDDAETAINSLRNNDKRIYTQLLIETDVLIITNEAAQSGIMSIVGSKIDEAEAITSQFSNESTITAQSIQSARSAYDAAVAEFESKSNMLISANIATLTADLEEQLYAINKARVLLWIIEYEARIDALDLEASTIGADIAAVKQYRSGFSGSTEEGLLNALDNADKSVLQQRIEDADDELNEIEIEADDAIKNEYLIRLEEALNADLTIRANVDEAMAKLRTLEDNVTIEEADGNLYTRYNTAKSNLTAACEAYVTAEINSVSEMLDGRIAEYTDFNSIRNKYNAIDVNKYVSAQSSNYQTITNAYNALTTKIQSNGWYYISHQGLSVIEQNSDGIYFEMIPQHPNRINYNKQIDLSVGFEAEIRFDQIAYYNGDIDQNGNSLGANNLCLSFLASPNTYKGLPGPIGINVIIWLFEVESNVQVVNANDVSIGNCMLNTPINGGILNVKLKYDSYFDFVEGTSYYAYIFEFNGNQIVLKPEQLTNGEIEIPAGNKVYFSFGSFADNKANRNCFTLMSINGVSLAAAAEEVPQVDKSELAALIEEVEALTEEDYTPETWDALETALENARAIMDNEEATQQEVDSAKAALLSAKNALEEAKEEEGGCGCGSVTENAFIISLSALSLVILLKKRFAVNKR